jgi:uncharacterized protein (DUF2249 family)/iron-sulfur cluster repair protein YtfE (RIC family)
MQDVVIASSDADALAAAAVEAHHAQLSGTLAHLVERLLAAASGRLDGAAARTELVSWCRRELVPHALAEEQAMYPAALAKPEGRLLVTAMLGEHGVITGLVDEVTSSSDDVRAAAAATALRVLFDSHLRKENELVLPLLTSAPEVSVAALLDGMHELLGGETHEPEQAEHAPGTSQAGHTCGCSEADGSEFPELDVRSVPHAIRHATVFGALDAVPPGGGLVVVAPHDPLPLLAQIEQRSSGAFTSTYLSRGPEAWRIELVRRPSA